MSVPASRMLDSVLREALAEGDEARLVLGTGGATIPPPEGYAYVNVVIGGQTVKLPRLSGVAAPTVGAVAYVLATRNFMLYLGTVTKAV